MGKLWVAFLYASWAANMNTFCDPLNASEEHAENVQCTIYSTYSFIAL